MLLAEHKVAAIFGCWTSASRKEVLPVVERGNGLLFYPSQYEGEESSPNIYYTGATPHQQGLPAINYLRSQGCSRFFLVGTDYVYPRTTNAVLSGYLAANGIGGDNVAERYTAFGQTDWHDVVADIRSFARGGRRRHHLDGERRRQSAFLPRARAAGRARRQDPGHVADHHRGRAAGADALEPDRPSGGLELSAGIRPPREPRLPRRLAPLHRPRRRRHQRSDGSHLDRLPHVGRRGREGRQRPRSTRCAARSPAAGSTRRPASR